MEISIQKIYKILREKMQAVSVGEKFHAFHYAPDFQEPKQKVKLYGPMSSMLECTNLVVFGMSEDKASEVFDDKTLMKHAPSQIITFSKFKPQEKFELSNAGVFDFCLKLSKINKMLMRKYSLSKTLKAISKTLYKQFCDRLPDDEKIAENLTRNRFFRFLNSVDAIEIVRDVKGAPMIYSSEDGHYEKYKLVLYKFSSKDKETRENVYRKLNYVKDKKEYEPEEYDEEDYEPKVYVYEQSKEGSEESKEGSEESKEERIL